MVLYALTTACSGSSSASLSPAAPSTSAFAARTFSSGAALTTLDHGRSGDESTGHDADSNENEGHGNGREAQLEGTIASIDAAKKTFLVRTTTVNVLTTTVIRRGDMTVAFADLKAGDQVHVKGAMNGAAIDAREVKVQTGEGPEDAGEASGTVSALAGTCPAISFTLGTTKVATDISTTFGHALCTDVANGAHVEVKGTVKTDGSILATRVSVDHEGTDDND